MDSLLMRISALEKENAELQTITQQLEQRLKEQNTEMPSGKSERLNLKEYKQLFHSLTQGFALHEIICNNDNQPINYRFLDVNNAFGKLTGLSKNQIIGKTVLEILPNLEKEWIETYGKVALTGKSCQFESYTGTLDKHYEILAFSPGKNLFATLFNDITERRILEKKLLETMIHTEEQERQKFASDLHDEIGPILSSLNLYIATLAESDDKNKKAYIIPQIQTLIREAITTVRDLSNDLSPHVLLNNSLEKAIKAHLELRKDLIPVIFRSNLKGKRFPHSVELAYYRIVKELLNNTIKHAEATKVTINLTYSNDLLKIKYSDNGVGFNPEDTFLNSTGMGMINIFSRAKTINAQYQINTKPGHGFEFKLWANVLE